MGSSIFHSPDLSFKVDQLFDMKKKHIAFLKLKAPSKNKLELFFQNELFMRHESG